MGEEQTARTERRKTQGNQKIEVAAVQITNPKGL
jgi:hypothetical protein